MSTSLKAHSMVLNVVRQSSPREDLRRQRVFAWAVTALLISSSALVSRWLTVVTGPAKATSKLRRLVRWPELLPDRLPRPTSTAISGASMYLYVCVGGASVAVTSTTTNSAGRYVFSDLDGPAWYYVAAGLTGPLANMVPATGTQNPTALVGVGEGDSDLDLAFE